MSTTPNEDVSLRDTLNPPIEQMFQKSAKETEFDVHRKKRAAHKAMISRHKAKKRNRKK